MAFISLPSELLSQIAQIVSQAAPNDIEDLGRACRRLRNISWPLIIEHRKSLVEYTRVDANNAVAANLLFEICRRPWVAIYPKSLDLTANKHLRTLQRPKTVKQVALVDAFKAKSNTVSDEDLEETLFRTGLIPKAHAAWWVESIRHGDEDYLFAALLACLPNVERLNIGLDLEKLEQTKEMLRNIKKEWNQNLALTKLTTVQVRERDGARHCDLELFPLLAAIPGVQKLHASVSLHFPLKLYCSDAHVESYRYVSRVLQRRLAVLSWCERINHTHPPGNLRYVGRGSRDVDEITLQSARISLHSPPARVGDA